MLWIIIVYAVLLSALTGYTMSIQGTTLALGRLLIYEPSISRGTGVQDAITPKSQNIRNVVIIILFIALFITTTYAYAWYHGAWVLVITFLASTAFPIVFGFRAGSQKVVSIILADMKKRRKLYLDSGDELRSSAIDELISRINEIPSELLQKEIKR